MESDLVSITAVDPATIPDSSDKPDNLPYGLFDLLIKADAVGGTAKVTFYLESQAGNDDKWFKYKNSTGIWEDCSAYAVFNAARDQVTLTLVDGGDGDDGPADGWIVDPSGLEQHFLNFYVIRRWGWWRWRMLYRHCGRWLDCFKSNFCISEMPTICWQAKYSIHFSKNTAELRLRSFVQFSEILYYIL